MGEQRNWACSYVHSYFDNAWSGPDVTAQAALDQAKAAAVRELQRKIEAVEGVSFGAFRDRCLHESVEPSTARHPADTAESCAGLTCDRMDDEGPEA